MVKRKSQKVRMDPGWDPMKGFFSGLIVIGSFNIIGALSNLVPVCSFAFNSPTSKTVSTSYFAVSKDVIFF